MSETLNAAADAVRERLSGGGFEGSVKFDVEDEGVIRIVDGDVVTEDGDADVTISASIDTLREMFDGELSPTAAYMTGRIKIDGDMSKAMALGQLLG